MSPENWMNKEKLESNTNTKDTTRYILTIAQK